MDNDKDMQPGPGKAGAEKQKRVPKKQKRFPDRTPKPQAFHGARRSKVDPELMAIAQHEAHKMRIFKIIMGLAAFSVLCILVISLIQHFRDTAEAEAHVAASLEKMNALEKLFEKGGYLAGKSALEASLLAEDLALFGAKRADREIQEDMKKRMAKYNAVMLGTAPVAGGKNDSFISSAACIDMVAIPAGEFWMGTSPSVFSGFAAMVTGVDPVEMGGSVCQEHWKNYREAAETPEVKIRISKDFWMSRSEVTVRQFRKLVPQYAMKEWRGVKLDKLDNPAGNVSWDEAMFFCQKLTELERRAGRLPKGYEYRLPTEAEWEYACRAGSDSVFYWGDEFGKTGAEFANSLDLRAAKEYGWSTDGAFDAAPADGFKDVASVGRFKPNAFGLYDMAGNVSEWCYDWYDPGFYQWLEQFETYRTDPLKNESVEVAYTQYRPFDAGTVTRSIPCRSIRGGNWGNLPGFFRSAARDFMPQNERNNGVGFRIVLAPVIESKIKNERL